MKIFGIYHHPTLGYKAIKRGFCWPAFFFGWLWALCARLWFHAVAFVVVLIGITAAFVALLISSSSSVDEGAINAFGIIISIIMQGVVGTQGNEWRAKNLTDRGYKKVAVESAKTKDAAIASHVRNYKKDKRRKFANNESGKS